MLSEEVSKHADGSELHNLEALSPKGSCGKQSTTERFHAGKILEAIGGIGLITLCAAVFYRVRELLAALILFSFVFGVVIAAVLIFWLVEEATHEAAGRLTTHMSHISARHNFAPSRGHTSHFPWNLPWN